VANSHLVAVDAARPRTVAAVEGATRIAIADLLEVHKAYKRERGVEFVGDDEAQVLAFAAEVEAAAALGAAPQTRTAGRAVERRGKGKRRVGESDESGGEGGGASKKH
jgi:hypothetical protein